MDCGALVLAIPALLDLHQRGHTDQIRVVECADTACTGRRWSASHSHVVDADAPSGPESDVPLRTVR